MENKPRSIVHGQANIEVKNPNKWRVSFMLGFLFLLFLALIGRAAYLQLINKEFLKDKGEARYARNITIPAFRGKILDRNGEIIAMSSPVKSVWALPEDAKLNAEELKNLAKLLEMKPQEIKSKIEKGKNFTYLKRQVEPEIYKQIEAAKFPGIHLENTFKRYYPNAEMTAHITGFTDLEDMGQEGIELAKNKELSGRNGERNVLKNRRGQVIEEVGATVLPINGKDIQVTIDSKIQFIAVTALDEAVKKHNAKAGAVVVLDAKTGEILALANSPDYNPNTREGLTGEKLRNRAITDLYEPGSTMKPFAVALALDKNLVRGDQLFDTREIVVGGKSIGDAHGHDSLTVAQIIQKSSNIGTVKIAMKLTPKEMWEMFDGLGFGKKVGVGFPGEAKGVLRPVKNWKPIEQATMSFGHGISVNLLQMAKAFTAITNDGEVRQISLIKQKLEEIPSTKVFSKKTAQQMQLMLESVTSKEGTASQARTISYRVAGKTGTANKLVDGRYASKYVGSFIGFAPVSDPRLVIAVMIDEPRKGGYYGGIVAAPVFAKIAEGALQSMKVAPDIIVEAQAETIAKEGKAKFPKEKIPSIVKKPTDVSVGIKPIVPTKKSLPNNDYDADLINDLLRSKNIID
jgi:cell division protein FtsI (penicillin-binding protein 3)